MTPHTQLWLTLSRAFLPPTDREIATAFLESLPAELEELCEAGGIEALPDIGALAESLDLIGSPDALLVHYSGLFLPPSARASLNLAIHLDGSLNGSPKGWSGSASISTIPRFTWSIRSRTAWSCVQGRGRWEKSCFAVVTACPCQWLLAKTNTVSAS